MNSLKFKLIVAGLIISTLPLLIYQLITFQQSSQTLIATYAKDLKRDIELSTLLINQSIFHTISDLKLLSSTSKKLLEEKNFKELTTHLKQMEEIHHDIDATSIFDKDGKVLGTTFAQKNDLVIFQKSVQESIQKLLRSNSDTTLVFEKMLNGEPKVFVLNQSSTATPYFFLAQINFQIIELLLFNVEDETAGDEPVYLLNQDNQIIFASKNDYASMQTLPHMALLTDETRLDEHIYEIKDPKNHEIISSYDTTLGFGITKALRWKIFTSIPVSIINHKVYETLKINQAIGFFIIFTTFIILTLFARKITQALLNVLELARKLSQGDYTARTAKSTETKELQDLTLILNDMAKEIETRSHKLENQKKSFEAIYTNSKDAIAILDMESNFIDVNPAFLEMTHYAKDEILSTSLCKITVEKNQKGLEKIFQDIKSHHFIKDFEKEFITKDQKVITVNMSVAMIPDPDRILINARDVTKSKEIEQHLLLAKQKAEDATQSKSAFLANMSHEIRTPMNGILGLSHLALKNATEPKQRMFLERIDNSAKSLLGIINDILDLSKIEAGKLDIEHHPFDLHTVIQSVTDLIEVKVKEKHLELVIDYDTPLSTFKGDSLRLSQILTNLLGNAIKFTSKGKVTLKVSSISEDRLRFEVMDTGIGLSQEQQSKLFQSFSQADNSTTRKYGGTGLGLSITKQLVELMNGKIWVESEPGVGSRFIFEIELQELDPAEYTKATIQDESLSTEYRINTLQLLKEKQILVVDDSDTNVLVIMAMLETSGMAIDIAQNGQEALDKMSQNYYDMILMDIQMPIMDGYEASGIIRQTNKEIPIIALSANAMQDDILKSKRAGMNTHLNKPLEIEKFYDTLVTYLHPAS